MAYKKMNKEKLRKTEKGRQKAKKLKDPLLESALNAVLYSNVGEKTKERNSEIGSACFFLVMNRDRVGIRERELIRDAVLKGSADVSRVSLIWSYIGGEKELRVLKDVFPYLKGKDRRMAEEAIKAIEARISPSK